jgi:hypothetical protein
MNNQVRKIAVLAAAGVAAVLVLTACSRIVSNQPVVSGPNGVSAQTQSITLEQATPAEQTLAPLQGEPERVPAIAAPATTTKVEEKLAAPVPASAAETAKASEQVKSAEKAAAQEMHHCSGYDGSGYAGYDD